MDLTQIVVVLSLIAITITFVIVGIWLAKVLREIKLILEDTHSITSSVAKPVNSFSEFLMGFKNGFAIFNKLFPEDKHEPKK